MTSVSPFGRALRATTFMLAGAIAATSMLFIAPPAHAAPPANDDCANPQTIQLGQTPFSTLEATSAQPGVCVSFGMDVWFKHRAKFNGLLSISTCDTTNFDTVITVYRGTSCNVNNLLNNQLACSNNTSGCSGGTSTLLVNVTKDQTYLIRVGGYLAFSGTGILTLACGDPENAACADIIKSGAAENDRLGYSIGRGGLMNGDNDADQLVGAYLNDDNGVDAGAAFAFAGPNLTDLYTKTGAAASDNYGFSVATGDVNGDGRIDLIIGAPLNDDNGAQCGKVYVYNGFNGNELWSAVGQTAGDRFGNAVGFAGDVNDDGFGDVIVGAPFNDANGTSAGRAYILDGENGSRLRTHTGQNEGDQFGAAVTGVGDLNEDDHDDYIIGEPRYDNGTADDTGRATIFNGDTGGVQLRIVGDNAGDRFGSSVAANTFVATFDYTFIAIGSPFNDFGNTNAGRVRVFSRNYDNPGEFGCTKIVCLRYTLNGAAANGRLGSSVALGDLVGNSAADIIIGAPYQSASGGNNSGAAYVFDGNGASLSRRFFGEAAGDRFGTAVAFADDIEDDGENDLIVGGPFNDSGGTNAGRAYAFLFGSTSLLRTAAPEVAYGDGGQPIMPESHEVIGDATLDGVVNVNDLITIVSAWGPCPVAQGSTCPADVNRNGRVDVDDLLLVVASMPK